VDEAGKCQEVVLAVSEYRVLMDLLEDYADSVDLDEAIEAAGALRHLIRGRRAKARWVAVNY
jgi:hypothetical protein